MCSLFTLALLALTGARAQLAERIFIDGKGVQNLAAATGSSSTPSQLIHAALLGSGSVLSQFANGLPNYQNADANTFSIKPALPPRTTPPPTRPPLAQAPQQDTLTGFTMPEPGSSSSTLPGSAVPSTTISAPTTTTAVTTMTAAPTTTAAVTPTRKRAAARSTTDTTTSAPTTTMTTTAPITTTTTTVAPGSTMTSTTHPTATSKSGPTKTSKSTAVPHTTMATAVASTTTATNTTPPSSTSTTATTITTTALASITTVPTTAPITAATTTAPTITTTTTSFSTMYTTTTSMPTTTSSTTTSTATTAPAATTSEVVTSSTTLPTATTTPKGPATTSATEVTAISPPPSTTTTVSLNTAKTSTASTTGATTTAAAPTTSAAEDLTAANTYAPAMATSTEAVLVSAQAPKTLTTDVATPSTTSNSSTLEAQTAETPTNIITILTTPTTTSESNTGFVTTGASSTNSVGASAKSSNSSPAKTSETASGTAEETDTPSEVDAEFTPPSSQESDENGAKTTLASDARTGVASGFKDSDALAPHPDEESFKPSPSLDGGALEGTPLLAMIANHNDSSSKLGSMSQTADSVATPRKPIIVSSTGRVTATAVFSGNASTVVSAEVNDDPDKGTETATITAPEELDDTMDEADVMTEEGADASPESEAESEILEPLIPMNPGRPIDVLSLMEDIMKVVDADSSESADPKSVIFDEFQALFDSISAGNVSSPDPEDMLLPEPSSETKVYITSALGSILHSLPLPEETTVPEPSVKPLDGLGAFPFAGLADSLSSSFGNGDNIGPMPVPSMEVKVESEALEILESMEPTLAPVDIGDFLQSMEEDVRASDEPEASTEEVRASGEMEILEVDLIVKHPGLLDPVAVAEEIRLVSDGLTEPLVWNEEGLFLLANFSKFGSAISVVRQANHIGFELNLWSTCLDPSGCESEMSMYNDFVRNGRMDETLAAHDMEGVNVHLKGDVIDRATPQGMDAAASSGLNGGIVASIAIGAVACVSLFGLGVVFIAKRGQGGKYQCDTEQGRIESPRGSYEERQTQTAREGSFLISNFGGSPRNTDALIPWMSNSSGSSAGHERESSNSFISVDTEGTAEITPNNPSQYLPIYRFEETKSTESGSDWEP